MQMNLTSNLPNWAVQSIQLLLIIFLSFIFRYLLQRSLRLFIKRLIQLREDENPETHASRGNLRTRTLTQLSDSLVTVFIFGVSLLLVLDQFGLNLAPLLAGASVAGLAIGFGAQAFVKDLFAGISVLAEDQYGVGDVIDFGESSGVVESISLKSTRVRGLDGTLWHLPNGEITRVANKTQGWSRVILDLSVSYSSNLDFVFGKIDEALKSFAGDSSFREKIIAAPEIWGVEKLGDNSVEIRIVVKVLPGEHWQIARHLRLLLKNKFDVEGIEIPFPQIKVWNAELEER